MLKDCGAVFSSKSQRKLIHFGSLSRDSEFVMTEKINWRSFLWYRNGALLRKKKSIFLFIYTHSHVFIVKITLIGDHVGKMSIFPHEFFLDQQW